MTAEKFIPLFRDLVCMAVGAYGFVWQVTHGADPTLMAGCIVTLGGPAVIATWSLARNGGPGTTELSSSSPGQPSPAPSSSPPSSPPAGGER
jgi:hypothetical protein